MRPVVRLHDLCFGHGCYPPRENIEGSPNVFVNNRAVVRVGDAYAPHGCGVCPPHGGAISAGSPNVFVNGRAVARKGDPLDCGSTANTDCMDTFVN